MVIRQVRLWEEERNRAAFSTGTLLEEFKSEAEFMDTRQYARDNHHVLWAPADDQCQDPAKRYLIVKHKSAKHVLTFLKSRVG